MSIFTKFIWKLMKVIDQKCDNHYGQPSCTHVSSAKIYKNYWIKSCNWCSVVIKAIFHALNSETKSCWTSTWTKYWTIRMLLLLVALTVYRLGSFARHAMETVEDGEVNSQNCHIRKMGFYRHIWDWMILLCDKNAFKWIWFDVSFLFQITRNSLSRHIWYSFLYL